MAVEAEDRLSRIRCQAEALELIKQDMRAGIPQRNTTMVAMKIRGVSNVIDYMKELVKDLEKDPSQNAEQVKRIKKTLKKYQQMDLEIQRGKQMLKVEKEAMNTKNMDGNQADIDERLSEVEQNVVKMEDKKKKKQKKISKRQVLRNMRDADNTELVT